MSKNLSLHENSKPEVLQGLGFLILFVFIFIISIILRALVIVPFRILRLWLALPTFIDQTIGYILSSLFGLIIVLVFFQVIYHYLFQENLSQIFTNNKKEGFIELLFGIFTASLTFFIIFIFELSMKWISIDSFVIERVSFDEWITRLVLSLTTCIVVAIIEETLFRGILLKGVRSKWGTKSGLLISAFIFGFVHIFAFSSNSDQFDPIVLTLTVTVVGLVFGYTYIKTESLWLPIGLHFAYNFIADDFLNLIGQDISSNQLFGFSTILY